MASPRVDGPLSQSQTTQPLTPPAEPSQSNTTAPSSSTAQHQSQGRLPTSQSTGGQNASNSASTNANPAVPLTSLADTGLTKRPRDARLIHLILSSMGVSAYQERVPLQLLDFAYRYTSSVLTDALHIQAEGYDTADSGAAGGTGKGRGRGTAAANAAGADDAFTGGGGAGAAGKAGDGGGISLTALRMAIGSRTQYQFQQGMPKEFLVELAAKRNAIGLPGSVRGAGAAAAAGSITNAAAADAGVSVGGVRLPPEKYCLSGMGWGLKESWDSDGEEGEDDDYRDPVITGGGVGGGGAAAAGNADVEMAEDENELEGEDDDREGMEALFGKAGDGDAGGGGGGGGGGEDGDGDQEMGDG